MEVTLCIRIARGVHSMLTMKQSTSLKNGRTEFLNKCLKSVGEGISNFHAKNVLSQKRRKSIVKSGVKCDVLKQQIATSFRGSP